VPRVPTYDGPQVQQQALRPVQQGPIDVSSGVQALGRQVDKMAMDWAQAQANDVDVRISQDWMKWEAENRPKYQGANGKDYPAAADAWWKKAAETYGKDLDPITRQLISPALSRKQVGALGAAQQFAVAETERHFTETTAARIDTEVQMGVTTGQVAGARANISDAVATLGVRRGWSPEQVQAETGKQLGRLHAAHIENLARVNPDAAMQYFEANKAEVPAAAQPRITEVLTGEADNRFARTRAAELAALPFKEQLAEAAKEANPARREKLLVAVKQNQASVKEAERQDQEAAADAAWRNYVDKGRTVPEALIQRMNANDIRALREHQRLRAERAVTGEKVRTDWKVYLDLRERLFAGENVDLRPFTEQIAPAQLEQLVDVKTRTRDAKKAPEAVTMEQQVGAVVTELKLQNAEKGRFMSAAYDEFAAHQRRTGKEPTYDERQAIIDRLTTEVVTKPGMLWDSKEKPYNLPREQRAALTRPAAAAPATPVRVRTLDEARALPKGTRFIDPDGVERIR